MAAPIAIITLMTITIMTIWLPASRSPLTTQATSQVYAVDRAREAHEGLLTEMPTATHIHQLEALGYKVTLEPGA